jgi:serine/threonine protein kinase
VDDWSGRIVDGRYQLLRPIGHGSHGIVYRAHDHQLKMDVALKLLKDIDADAEYYVRMVREARAMSALAGTSAVPIYGWGADLDGSFYIAMEILEGMNLEEYLVRLEGRGERMPAEDIVRLLDPIVATLEAAHDRGIVHRDLKPSNIFLLDSQAGGGARLLDFGLVKIIGARPLTRQGFVAGSPNYIAPEAWRGNPAKLDHRIDVYSFGAILFRVLGGQVPFHFVDLFQLLQHVTQGARPSLRALRPDLGDDIDAWVEMSLAIDPEYRFARVRAMWAALRNILGVG